jgi:hypothetical protein
MRFGDLAFGITAAVSIGGCPALAFGQDSTNATYSWSTSNSFNSADSGTSGGDVAYVPGTVIKESFNASGSGEVLVPAPPILPPPGSNLPPQLPPPELLSFSGSSSSTIQVKANPYVSVDGNVVLSASLPSFLPNAILATNTAQASFSYAAIIQANGVLPPGVTTVPVLVVTQGATSLFGSAAQSSLSSVTAEVDVSMGGTSLLQSVASGSNGAFISTVLFDWDLASAVQVDLDVSAFIAAGGSSFNGGYSAWADPVFTIDPNFAYKDSFSIQFSPGVLNVDSIAAVPEPETYAMLLAGLGLLGWRTRQQHRLTRS